MFAWEDLSEELVSEIKEPVYDFLKYNTEIDKVNETDETPIISQLKPKKENDLEKRLLSEKGLTLLIELLRNTKFQGPGQEKNDLHKLVLAYEHWAHNLAPRLTFNLFIERIQNLGNQTLIKFKQKLQEIRRECIKRNCFDETVNNQSNENSEEELNKTSELFQESFMSHSTQLDFEELSPSIRQKIIENKQKALRRKNNAKLID